MKPTNRAQLRQRADYTQRFNTVAGRHGWLRLTPAYSVKIVDELIATCDRRMRILDPFCGTATTALSAANQGHHGITTDINPFLVWLGRAKTARYSPTDLAEANCSADAALDLVVRGAAAPVSTPAIHNIERWWSAEALAFLSSLRAGIDMATEAGSAPQSLLLVAFCRTLIALSNAAFNHQSMSFKNNAQLRLEFDSDLGTQFRSDLTRTLQGAAENPAGSADVHEADARDIRELIQEPVDRVITSPPYVNRMSYIRELRPYMYWLGYLAIARDAGELDWKAIGGTWGIATSRLGEWRPQALPGISGSLGPLLEKISDDSNANGRLLANYVHKYFCDMYAHFASLRDILARNAIVHYIVGNSSFYGVLVPAELIYAEMLADLGFSDISIRAVRKRNSKKELVEFDVSARWDA